MEPSFWHERWSKGQTGFHQERVHPNLLEHAAIFLGGGPHRVLVPLCGKSWDLDWLARRGHQVVGVELSELAVKQLHDDHGRVPEVSQEGPFTAYRSPNLTVLVGDVFDLPTHVGVGAFDRVWDRASMVALPPPMRARYVEGIRSVGAGGKLLLNTLTYDPTVMSGPPFSVEPAEVVGSYPGVELLQRVDEVPPPFRARGHQRFEERVWLAPL